MFLHVLSNYQVQGKLHPIVHLIIHVKSVASHIFGTLQDTTPAA